ncbi:hypothetical protein LINPERPRIM_LOCUS14416, partial [Linum perenne]
LGNVAATFRFSRRSLLIPPPSQPGIRAPNPRTNAAIIVTPVSYWNHRRRLFSLSSSRSPAGAPLPTPVKRLDVQA